MRPFLKWAGSKHAIIETIQGVIAPFTGVKRLVEPFVGSGAVFLNTTYPNYLLTDNNTDLIQLYQTLQSHGAAFIAYSKTFFTADGNQAEAYYDHRTQFNETTDPVLKSALFLYLNRHGYNGLCRYNQKGHYNVPFGRYEKPYFPEREMMAFYQKSAQACFMAIDFEQLEPSILPGDIVYCDPPYVPLSQTANFTSYAAGGFSLTQQEQLVSFAKTLMEKGAVVLISNHNTPWTQALYRSAVLTELDVRRTISCQGAQRKKAQELLALFYDPLTFKLLQAAS